VFVYFVRFQSNGHVEITVDVVEPFSLDPDFDYDNVNMSTKFTDISR